MPTVVMIEGAGDPTLIQASAPASRVHIAPDMDSIPDEVGVDAEVIVLRSGVYLTAAVLDRFPRLAAVLRAGSGTDNIDLTELDRRGIQFLRNPGVSADAVAEWVLAASLALARRIPLGQAGIQVGVHLKNACLGRALSTCRVAVWGAGPVGRASGRLLRTMAADLAYAAWPSAPEELPQKPASELATWADVHIIALPPTSVTRQSFGATFLHRAANRRPLLVCAGRLDTLDVAACLAALRDGSISGLAIDPVEVEHFPLFPHEPQPTNLLITPHLGAQREDIRARLDNWVASTVGRLCGGVPA